MNKKELIEFIAQKAELTKVDAEKALEAFLEAVTTTLQKKEKITLTGFGSFSTTEKEAREYRNPLTGEPVKVPAKVVPKFKAGKKLKDSVMAGK